MRLSEALRKVCHELGSKGRYTYQDVITSLREQFPDLILESSKKLEDLGLRRMIADIETKQSRRFAADQGELFIEFSGLPVSVDLGLLGIGKRGERGALHKQSMAALDKILSQPEAIRKNLPKRERLRKLYRELLPFALSTQETLEDVMNRRLKNRPLNPA